MLNENAKKWVAALRSGKYQQGRQYLNADGKFCCLGVACEVAIENGLELFTSTDGKAKHYGGDKLYAPIAVVEWLGLTDQRGSFDQTTLCHRTDLAALNDHEDYDFNKIADFIELEPEGLFVEKQ